MPRFPIAEPEIAPLAALVVEGLEQAVEDFPTPPVPATELRAQLDTYAQTRAATVDLVRHSYSSPRVLVGHLSLRPGTLRCHGPGRIANTPLSE
jgi:hypothetical protein